MARAKDAMHDLRKLPGCIFCGSRSADCVWIGTRSVGVCLQCATEVLPKLIADAVYNRMNAEWDDPQATTERQWQVVRANFYEAVHGNDCRLLDEWQRAKSGGLS